MLCGISTWHIHILIEGSWNGGLEKSLEEVGRMTLDQVLFALADPKFLKAKMNHKGVKKEPLAVAASADSDGFIKGRAADGTPIKGRIMGKSLARQMMEEQEKKKQEKQKKRRGRKKR